jgi:hypothetical protein
VVNDRLDQHRIPCIMDGHPQRPSVCIAQSLLYARSWLWFITFSGFVALHLPFQLIHAIVRVSFCNAAKTPAHFVCADSRHGDSWQQNAMMQYVRIMCYELYSGVLVLLYNRALSQCCWPSRTINLCRSAQLLK